MLLRRYEVGGDVADVEAAVAAYRKARDIAYHGTVVWAIRSMGLGFGLSRRFDAVGRAADLDEAIRVLREAIAKLQDGTRELANAYSRLGSVFAKRFRLLERSDDINEALRCHREAISLGGIESDSVLFVANLSFSLQLKYASTPSRALLAEIIATGQQALHLCTETLSERARWLENLARALMWRYQDQADLADLDRAINVLREAVDLNKEGSPSWATCQANLGQAFLLKFEATQRQEDREAALRVFLPALTTLEHKGCLAELLIIAPKVGLLLGRLAVWDAAADVLEIAVRSFETLYRAQLSGAAQIGWLSRAKDVHGIAAYALAKAGKLEEAVLTLEAGRARQLNDALDISGAELQTLSDAGRVDLVERYQRAAEQVSRMANIERANSATLTEGAFEQIASRAKKELGSAIDAIRRIPGNEAFMAPPNLTNIVGSLRKDRLVYLASVEFGGLMLAVMKAASTIDVFWLPELTSKEIDGRISEWRTRYIDLRTDITSSKARKGWLAALDDITRWLWDAAGLGKIADAAAARDEGLILVPMGLLGFLPLHAAWTEDLNSRTGRRYVLDATPVRYAPNGNAYVTATRAAGTARVASALVVRDPEPVAEAPLPSAELETKAVCKLMPGSTLIGGAEATRERVLAALNDHNVHHFCCHAFADQTDPLSGGLLMSHDKVLTLRDVLNVRLHRARLAVLSACETGMLGDRLPDEVISLAAGFLQAGSAGVVASLWVVSDIASACLIARFYEAWLVEGEEPWRGLCTAQAWLRDTTNAEKVEWCKTWLPECGGRAGPLSDAASIALRITSLAPAGAARFCLRPPLGSL